MGAYLIQDTVAQAIADGYRKANGGSTATHNGMQLAFLIGDLDPKMTSHTGPFENGYWGLRAAKCASTYLLARVMGTDKFAYNTNNIFTAYAGTSTPYVRDGLYGRIDCSSFIGLVLRGIPYEKSPYALHKGENERWTPLTELESMYGTEGWEQIGLDWQPYQLFSDHDMSENTWAANIGRTSIRYAADLGRYFHKYGYRIYDRTKGDNVITTEKLIAGGNNAKLQPGDLVFWDTSENETVDARFMAISHVGMVAENTSFYYEVTGTEGVYDQDVIKFTQFSDNGNHPSSNIVLIVRPDYRPRMPKEETPIGINLLEYPWTYSRQASYTTNGITITLVDKNTFSVDGTSTAATTIRLKDYADSDDHLTLSPGTYELSGIPSDFTGTSFALQVRDASDADFTTQIRYPTGSSATNTFTLTEETDVTVRMYISSGKTLSGVIVVPTLVRTA